EGRRQRQAQQDDGRPRRDLAGGAADGHAGPPLEREHGRVVDVADRELIPAIQKPSPDGPAHASDSDEPYPVSHRRVPPADARRARGGGQVTTGPTGERTTGPRGWQNSVSEAHAAVHSRKTSPAPG